MTFSCVIPSYLGPYPSAARNREEKIYRAIYSCFQQTYKDFEVIVVADGCQKTVDLLQGIDDPRLSVHLINHRKLWSGYPRNKGIDEGKGDYIIYLDIDDLYGVNHLETISKELDGHDWVWFNDLRFDPLHNIWKENECNVHQLGHCGTSNVCHRRDLGARWDEDGRYAHDYYFIQRLLTFGNYKKISTPEYYVCHVPGTKVSGGYDI